MKRILLCGGQGDPIYNSELIPIIRYFKRASPDLRITIVTNGSYKDKKWWSELAGELNEFDAIVFSIDGWDQDSNIKYRVNSDFESILVGVKEMVRNNILVHWSTIVFKFNQSKIETIKALAKSLGVHYFNLVFSTKFDGAWVDGSGVDPLKPDESFLATLSSYEKNIVNLNETNGKSQIKFLQTFIAAIQSKANNARVLLPRCMIGERGLYVDASGIIYPCSWISHPYDSSFPAAADNFFIRQSKLLNLNSRPLEAVINDPVWMEFFSSWSDKKSLYSECRQKCGDFKTAFEHIRFDKPAE